MPPLVFIESNNDDEDGIGIDQSLKITVAAAVDTHQN
jgi:hypothetical protein